MAGIGPGSFEDAFERQHDALAEFMRGNTEPFKALFSRRDDATLANPFGGVARGWGEIPGRLDLAASHYRDGEVVSIETISADHDGDFGYGIEIEHLRARIGGHPQFQDVGLRTTTVFRREPSGWTLIHRHADPAVGQRTPEATF
jgi:ketosteroid isomerase-like protein